MSSFKTFLSESINDKGILKVIFLIGFPGSGKSYTISRITSGTIEPRIVNTDRLIEYYGRIGKIDLGQTEENRVIIDRSIYLNQQLLFNYLNGILPLYIDSTSSNISNLMLRYGALESLGYDIGAIFVDTDIDIAIERIKKRNRKVPIEFIREVKEKIDEVRPFYKEKFKFYHEVKNNYGELTDNIILKAYKLATSFYTSEIQNPVGQRLLKKMKEKNEKYLIPNIYDKNRLLKVVNLWYR